MSEREERILRSLSALQDGARPDTRAMFVLAVNSGTLVSAARDFSRVGAQVDRDGDVLLVREKA